MSQQDIPEPTREAVELQKYVEQLELRVGELNNKVRHFPMYNEDLVLRKNCLEDLLDKAGDENALLDEELAGVKAACKEAKDEKIALEWKLAGVIGRWDEKDRASGFKK